MVGCVRVALAWVGCTLGSRASRTWQPCLVAAPAVCWVLVPWVGCQVDRGTLMVQAGLEG